MARETHWSDMKVGVIGAAALAVLVIFVLFFAKVGELHGDKVKLYVLTADATGVMKGTDIWLAGQKIGQVQDVRFMPVTRDTSERILIESEILGDRLSAIRRDTRAEIKPGKSMIGVPVVNLTGGTSAYPALHDGDTIRSAPTSAVADLGDDMTNAANEVKSLAAEARKLSANLSSPHGTVGAARVRGIPGLGSATAQMSTLEEKMTRGNGTVGLAMRNDIAGRFSRAMSGVDSIKLLLASDRGNVGRFRRDSTLPAQVAGIHAQLDSLFSLLSDPVGTIAARHTDSTLIRQLIRARAQTDSLMRDLKKHPLRYLSP
jgi:MlaD protein